MTGKSKVAALWASLLIALGILALWGGPRLSMILVPAAILIYYGTAATIFPDRHSDPPSGGGTHP
jgi:hypothetical protein